MTPGTVSSASRISDFELLERGAAVGLEHDEHVRHDVRHRVFGPLGAARAPHHVLDVVEAAQHVLDAVVDAIDLLERRVGRHHRLQQERAFVELRHEVGADGERQQRSPGR